MDFAILLLLLIFAPAGMPSFTSCPSSTFEHVVNSEGALEFPLFHTDHPCVQQHRGRPMSTEGITETDDTDLPIDLIRNDSINNFAFLMPIQLGTPPVWNLVAVDTGSPFCFVQCRPCTLWCNNQEGAGQIFDPKKSKSFRRIGCSAKACRALQSRLRLPFKACMEKEDSCLYTASYGKGSYYSVGKLVADTISIGRDGKGYSIPSFIFGCSLDIEYDQGEAGIFGFGAAPSSFFSQVVRVVNYRALSYCFPSDRKKTGYLSIGDYNRDNSTSYTPLFVAHQRPVFALTLDKVVVNGITLITDPSEMMVDTGAKWTVLRSDTFSQLETVISKALRTLGYKRTLVLGPNHMCYEDDLFTVFRNWSALPVVQLSFDMGATLTLAPEGSFHFTSSNGLCTYFMRDAGMGKAGLQLMGNSVTRSIGVTFDFQGGRFAFRDGDC
ncbi:hypothetical protein ACQJBY_052744 [Aegilops geniculata]